MINKVCPSMEPCCMEPSSVTFWKVESVSFIDTCCFLVFK